MKQRTSASPVDAQIEIEHTRRELLKFLADERAEEQSAAPLNVREGGDKSQSRSKTGFDWSTLLGAGVSSWWHEHPARSVAILLQSATSEYARKKPIQVVSIAAAAGAVVVLLRPWRLVSVTALMLTLFRSSNFTGMASSVLETAAQSMQKTQKERP